MKSGIRSVSVRFFAGIVLTGLFWLGAGEVTGAGTAFAGTCDACKTEYNKCRIQRRGHTSCDRAYEACLKNCVRSSRRR